MHEQADLPFTPADRPLRDVLRQQNIKKVATWLLGKDEMSILAQAGNSAWESALTISILSSAVEIFQEAKEEEELVAKIRRKSVLVAKWLLSKKHVLEGGKFAYWEGVTWDTAVIIQALLLALDKYQDDFSTSERQQILDTGKQAAKWLYYRFQQWETSVKYPFGPADVSRIVTFFVYLSDKHTDLFAQIQSEYRSEVDEGDDGEWFAPIIEYLLHRKTEQTLTVHIEDSPEKIVTYWWDDYFNTAEVIEGLSYFYEYCDTSEDRSERYRRVLRDIKEAVVRACSYFEQGQVDGMWGSHIDTIKVIHAYVMINRTIPLKARVDAEGLIVPEIHTTFKALRFLCDEKQIFSDGSFLHTMFLTIFYADALIEVYRCWKPACDTIEKIYDDVVWFSPVRTTPERIKRLSVEIENSELESRLQREEKINCELRDSVRASTLNHVKTIVTIGVVLLAIFMSVFVGNTTGAFNLRMTFQFDELDNFLAFVGMVLSIMAGAITAIWKYSPHQKED